MKYREVELKRMDRTLHGAPLLADVHAKGSCFSPGISGKCFFVVSWVVTI